MTAFNVAGLLHEAPGATRHARLRDHYVTLGPDVELAGPLDADLRLQRTNRGIIVRGEPRAPLRRTGARRPARRRPPAPARDPRHHRAWRAAGAATPHLRALRRRLRRGGHDPDLR